MKHLISEGIKVVTLGRQEIKNLIGASQDSLLYSYSASLPLSETDEYKFIEFVNALNLEEVVFYNLAWKGEVDLTGGSLDKQLDNVKLSCSLIQLAHRCKAKKYVTTGSMDEIYFEKLLNSHQWMDQKSLNSHSNYAISKIAARLQSSYLAYRLKLDFCYAHISITIDIRLCTQKYVEKTFLSILRNQPISWPSNNELCNVSSTNEIARQLHAVGLNGINGSRYKLGTGRADVLARWYLEFSERVSQKKLTYELPLANAGILQVEDFNTELLQIHTGYVPIENSDLLFSSLLSSQ